MRVVGSGVEWSADGRGVEIRVTCDLDFQHADRFTQAVARCGQGPVTLDLTGVRFIDSTGVQAFVQALRGLSQRGLEVREIRLAAPVFEVLELVGCVDVVGRHLFSVEG